MVSYPDTGAKF